MDSAAVNHFSTGIHFVCSWTLCFEIRRRYVCNVQMHYSCRTTNSFLILCHVSTGVLLIAVRRPFDLGDRIFICGSESVMAGDVSNVTFFVEDISLATTTLRYARTNEVSTVNNWSISGSRIVNCNRSPNAIISLELMMHISVLEREKLAEFRESLELYVRDNPRVWDSLAFCRHDNIDPDNEIVYFT